MGHYTDTADMNPHGSTGDCDRLALGQCSPQLGSMIGTGLEVHMDAIHQRQTFVSEFVVGEDGVGLAPNSVQAWRVADAEGEVESALACCRRCHPCALIAREPREQEIWPFGPLVEGGQGDRHDVGPPSELHHLGPREPAESVSRDRRGVSGPPLSLISHDRIVQVLVERPCGLIASCMVESPIVP